MSKKISNQWAKFAFATSVVGASFVGGASGVQAQFGSGYKGTVCPERDAYSQGYVTALGDENARYPALNRAFYCERQAGADYTNGYHDAKACVRSVANMLAEQYWRVTPPGWTMQLDAIVGKATVACYDNNLPVERSNYYRGLSLR